MSKLLRHIGLRLSDFLRSGRVGTHDAFAEPDAPHLRGVTATDRAAVGTNHKLGGASPEVNHTERPVL